jgi:hypothetical protein
MFKVLENIAAFEIDKKPKRFNANKSKQKKVDHYAMRMKNLLDDREEEKGDTGRYSYTEDSEFEFNEELEEEMFEDA